jgi:hypothetical protein
MSKYAYTRKSGSQIEVPKINLSPEESLEVTGYQGYKIDSKKFIDISHIHFKKYQIIRPYLKLYDSNKSIVDIGCSAGAIGIQAIFDKFKYVSFVDHDSEYIEIVRQCIERIGAKDSKAYISTVGDFNQKFDIAFAFALIHWIYSYSEKMGSLQASVDLLFKIAPKTIFIEWVAVDDPAIKDAEHIQKNRDIIFEPYNFENFLKALKARYKVVKKIGSTTKTREIWYATNEPVSPSVFSIIESKARIIYSFIASKIKKRIKKLSA